MAYVTRRTPETWPQAGHDNGKKRRRTVQGKKGDGSCSGRTYLKEQAKGQMRLNGTPRLRALCEMQGACELNFARGPHAYGALCKMQGALFMCVFRMHVKRCA